MKLAFLKNYRFENFKATFLRFPLSILSGAVATYCAIQLSRWSYDGADYNQTIEALMASSFIGILLFNGLAVFAERHKLRSWLIQLIGIPVLYLLIYKNHQEFSDIEMLRNALVFLSSLALIFSGPYLIKREDKGFWLYFMRVLQRALTAIATALIATVALSLALVSIENLFSVEIPSNWYEIIYSTFLIFVPNVVFLLGMPSDFKALEKEEPSFSYRAVCTYLFLPLLSVYFLILAAYVVKILGTQVWPDGFVAMPILIFTTIGFGMYTLVSPILGDKNTRLLQIFNKIFLWSMPVFMFVYFGAFWQRIEQYGVTEMRYLGVLLGMLILSWSLYFAFVKNARLKMIPASVFAAAFLASFGPWGASGVSEFNQHARLVSFLHGYGLLENGVIVPSSDEVVDAKARADISGTLDYLVYNYGADSVADIFPVEEGQDPYLATTSGMMEQLGLSYTGWNEWSFPPMGTNYYFSTNGEAALTVQGYDYLSNYYFYQYLQSDASGDGIVALNAQQNLVLHYDSSKNNLELTLGTKKLTVEVLPLLEQLETTAFDEGHIEGQLYPQDTLMVSAENGSLKAKVYFSSISYTLLDGARNQMSLDMRVLLDVK